MTQHPSSPNASADAGFGSARRVGAAALWLLIVLAIALGAAGLVTATPSAILPAARPELTGVADAAVTGRLDVAETDLTVLAAQVDALGTAARGALSALVSGRPATVDAAVAEGDKLVGTIGTQAAQVQTDLDAAPYVGATDADLHVSPAVEARYARLRSGLAAVKDLDVSWADLTDGAVTATRVSEGLAEHDRLVGLAAEQGRAAHYKEALVYLGQASDQILASRSLRTKLAVTVDVSVLDQWLDRNATYDKALRGLYLALNKVGGRVTKGVRDAIAAEKVAREQLPPDSRGLILIIADIGRGGMNNAVIAIEEAKATLSDALTPAPAPSAGGAAAPSATP